MRDIHLFDFWMQQKLDLIHKQIYDVYSINVNVGIGYRCVRLFNGRRMNVHDEVQSECPSSMNVNILSQWKNSERQEFHNIWLIFVISWLFINSHIWNCNEQPHYKKGRTKQVSKMLIDYCKKKCMGSSQKFLTQYASEGDLLPSWTLTGSETWVSHVTTESKQQSVRWHHPDSLRGKKFNQIISNHKVTCTPCWGKQGSFLVDSYCEMPHNIAAASCCWTMENLRHRIQNTWCNTLTAIVMFLHDKTYLHTQQP